VKDDTKLNNQKLIENKTRDFKQICGESLADRQALY